MSGTGGGGGPCGACKFLRRKCVKGCVFAPYFDSDQGTAHFAAVHKVFGASNASKLISRLPLHKRLDAVVTLCYEALARIRDPVYGCVAHIFALQQQVVTLQAELAYIQGRISTLQRLHLPPLPPLPHPPEMCPRPSSELSGRNLALNSATEALMGFDYQQLQVQAQHAPTEWPSSCQNLYGLDNGELDDGDLHALAREFVSRYLPGVRSKQE